jgi:hypothetical protein
MADPGPTSIGRCGPPLIGPASGTCRPSTVGRHRALAMAACELQRPFAFLVRPADHRTFRSYKCPPYCGRRTAASVEILGQQTTQHGRPIYGPTGRRFVCDCTVVTQVCLLKIESGWPDERQRVRAGHSSGELACAAGRRSTQRPKSGGRNHSPNACGAQSQMKSSYGFWAMRRRLANPPISLRLLRRSQSPLGAQQRRF